MHNETTLIGHVHDNVAPTIPLHYISVSEEEPKARPLILSVKILREKRERISFSAFKHAQVRVTLNCLGYFQAQWQIQRVGTYLRCVRGCCVFTWNFLKIQMSYILAPPDQAYHVCSRFLALDKERRNCRNMSKS